MCIAVSVFSPVKRKDERKNVLSLPRSSSEELCSDKEQGVVASVGFLRTNCCVQKFEKRSRRFIFSSFYFVKLK